MYLAWLAVGLAALSVVLYLYLEGRLSRLKRRSSLGLPEVRIKQTSIKFNGREVTSQPQRALISFALLLFGGLMAFFWFIVMFIMIPLSLPLHLLLRLFGRRGFVLREVSSEASSVSYTVSIDGFRKSQYRRLRPRSSGNREGERNWERISRQANDI